MPVAPAVSGPRAARASGPVTTGPRRWATAGPGPNERAPAAQAPHAASGPPPQPARTPTEDDRPTEVTPPIPRRSVTRRTKVTRHTRRTFGRAMGATLAATVVPGSGLLMINRKRAGGLVLGVFLLAVVALVIIGFTARRAALVQNLLSSRVLLVVMVGLVLAALAWITQIVRTYALARPRMLDPGRRVVGVVLVAALCLLVASPFGYAAQLVNSQRSLLDNLFGGGGGTSVAEAIAKPRLNVLLVGSDAGPDRTGARTDTMMLASIDTTTARTTLFALPRNIGYAQFPPGTPMAEKFPKGFHDAASPLSGDYLLNAVYAWGLDHPADAPTTPTANPGLNLLHETVAYMLGVDIDYYVEVNMAGLTSIIDAVGGVTVDVGPTPLPIGGVLPDGRHVRPSGYVPAGVQHLDGDQALWFARSRRDSDDYSRMGRQRCLLQSMLQQKSPADVITRFQDIAAATSNSVATNIPQEVLGALVALAGDKPPHAAEHLVRPEPARPQRARRTVQHQPRRRLLHARSRAERIRRPGPRTAADDHPGAPHDRVPTRGRHPHPDGRPHRRPRPAGLRELSAPCRRGMAQRPYRAGPVRRPVPPRYGPTPLPRPVLQLRATGAAIARLAHGQSRVDEVLQVPARGHPGHPEGSRDLGRRHPGARAQRGDHRVERLPADGLGQRVRPHRRAQGVEKAVHVVLGDRPPRREPVAVGEVALQLGAHGPGCERLHQVLRGAERDGGADDREVARLRHHDHVGGVARRAHPAQHLQAVGVGQVDVQQHEVEAAPGQHAQGVGAGRGLGHHLEAPHPPDVLFVTGSPTLSGGVVVTLVVVCSWWRLVAGGW